MDPDKLGAVELVHVRVIGNEQVPNRLIKNILDTEEIHPGIDLIVPDDARVYRARTRLAATGYFNSVNLRLEPLPNASCPAIHCD